MPTITKKELISDLSDITGLKHAEILVTLEAFMELVTKHLAEGSEITLRKFGTFDLRVAKSKVGRNPKRPNSEVTIPDRCVVRFRPSREMRDLVSAVPVQKLDGNDQV